MRKPTLQGSPGPWPHASFVFLSHQQKDFEKNDGEWSEKLENRKKKKKEKEKNGGKWGVCVGVGVGGELLAVGEACVSIFGPIPGLKGKHSSPLGDLNFWGS